MADSALPNLYRLYFGNTDDDNTTLTSTEKDLDKPTPVISELGCDYFHCNASQDGHILRSEMIFPRTSTSLQYRSHLR